MVKIIEKDKTPSTDTTSAKAQAGPVKLESQEQLVNAILSLPPEDLNNIARKLMPHIVNLNMVYPRIWGERKRVIMKSKVHINDLLLNTRSGTITIEEGAFFGHGCELLTGTHDYGKKGEDRLKAVPSEGRDIHIKEGVWMGSGATVLGPCVVGEHAVIAAGSLVTVDEIPAGTIWAGHPAKQIKEIDFK